MDVIEAINVEDTADVVYWNDDLSELPEDGQYFFRQTYDVVKGKGKQLSVCKPCIGNSIALQGSAANTYQTLKTYCVDRAPSNPDEPTIQCPSCSEWLHGHCLEEQAVQDACEENKIDKPSKKGPGRPKKGRKSSSTPAFEAEISITKSGKTRLTLTDKRPEQNHRRWHMDVKCLSCNAIIEKAVGGEVAEEEEEDKEEVNMPKETPNDEEDTIAVGSNPSTSKVSNVKADDKVEGKEPQDKTNHASSTETAQLDPTPIQSSSTKKRSEHQPPHTSDVATDTTSKSKGEPTTKHPISS